MGKTIAEKILGAHTKQGEASAGETIEASVDLLMVHEVLGSRIIPILDEMCVEEVWDPNRILVVNDHWAPAADIDSAEIHRRNRDFVRKHGIKHFCDVDCGICHQVLPEMGLVKPGDLVIGSDSHSTTYGAFNAFSTGLAATDSAIIIATGRCWFKVPYTIKITVEGTIPEWTMSKDLILKIISDLGSSYATYQSMEFHGSTIDRMSVGSRMTISNMTVEMGAKCSPMLVNNHVEAWMKERAPHIEWKPIIPDSDAEYVEEIEYDLVSDVLEPIVALPHSPENGRPIDEVDEIEVDQCFIGSCTNGRLEDLAIAAKLLKGKKIASNTRLIVTPASRETYLQALKAGYVEIFLEAGGIVTNSTCGACVGGHLGVLGKGEIAISSTNRNFRGRMGHLESEIYLASPATVAASAIKGKITDPRRI
ncbi:MAG: 3-isopropylmalate dehydratase large subunit 1 [Candidatus Thorarchaeota archaeon]|nr:MAG: 3-isopropylmalate dehydratase large subunit 1 [Candidatus Thorarchaeota archaeon]